MSHFMCAVITDGTKTVEEMMAPYQENNMDTVPPEYLDFVDVSDEYRDEYENGTFTYYHDPDDHNQTLRWSADDMFRVRGKFVEPEGYVKVEIPRKVVYPTFEQYMLAYVGEEPNEDGGYGYWENPNARWDWYAELSSPSWLDDVIGSSPVRLRDIDFDADRHVEIAKREWERDHDSFYFRVFGSRGMSMEQYVDAAAYLSFWACITPDGKWHDVAKMGWFGMADVSADEYHDWCVRFSRRFIDPLDGNCVMHVVNCHI